MPTYDFNLFNPPAPLARVSLRALHNVNTVADVPMLIDSGSDITLIPEVFVDELRLDLDPNETFELTGFDGHRSVAKSVQLDLLFLGRTFRAIRGDQLGERHSRKECSKSLCSSS